jgi:hypothetical protein
MGSKQTNAAMKVCATCATQCTCLANKCSRSSHCGPSKGPGSRLTGCRPISANLRAPCSAAAAARWPRTRRHRGRRPAGEDPVVHAAVSGHLKVRRHPGLPHHGRRVAAHLVPLAGLEVVLRVQLVGVGALGQRSLLTKGPWGSDDRPAGVACSAFILLPAAGDTQPDRRPTYGCPRLPRLALYRAAWP